MSQRYQSKYPKTQRFTLYWSSLNRYEDCGQHFLWSKGWGAIDCGGGPGKKKPRPIERSRHHAVMGIVIANVMDRLYNDELWKHKGLKARLLDIAEQEYRRELSSNFIDWRLSPSREELWETIAFAINGYLHTMKHQKLLGTYAKAEHDMVGYIDKWTPVGGRADLVFRRDDTGITIIDHKNSRRYKDRKTKKFMTYTDPDQLRWYAMCFFLSYGRMPDRLGFVYFRFPFGAPYIDEDGKETGELEEGVDWVPFTKDDLKGLARRAKDALRGMNREKFEANPVPSKCRFCDYETVCPQRQAQKQKNRRNRKKSDAFFDGVQGYVDFGMGSGGSILVDGE